MPEPTSPIAELPSSDPTVAYAADVERIGRASIGLQDDAWLTLALTLWRLPTLTADERRATMPEAADSLAAITVSAGLPATAPMFRVARALRSLYTGQASAPDAPDTVSELVFAVQGAVDELEIAGGYGLAYATLTNLETALGERLLPRVRGNLCAQQARALRQLGLLDMARDLYTAVMEQGYECDAKDVVTRGLLGVAIVASTRGNYPAARDFYERALANAEASRENDLMRSAHHGLMNCGFASGDLDSAMVHGWNVLRLCIHPDTRAEALLNMGEVCRLAGELDVALRVFQVAKVWTSIPRIRLHATSSAMLTAAHLGEHEMTRRLLGELGEQIPQVADMYSVTGARLERAESLYLLGDRTDARDELATAYAQCIALKYHEFAYQAERLQQSWDAVELAEAEAERSATPASAPVATRQVRRSEDYKVVLRSLRNLTSVAL